MSVKLNERELETIIKFLSQEKTVYVGKKEECSRFIKGVFWILRAGAQWRELPEQYGKWNSVFKQFNRWSQKGVWQRMQQAMISDPPDQENLLIDSTVVRAHPCSAGAKGW